MAERTDKAVIRHYFHCWADGGWREPLAQHMAALAAARFPGQVRIGLVGSLAGRREVLAWLAGTYREYRVSWEIIATAAEGWEGVTLSELHRDAVLLDPAAVLYAHTKGAQNATPLNRAWRRAMTRELVGGWRECTQLLADRDLVGCHWLAPGETFRGGLVGVAWPHFSGNFWWARSDYLARLMSPPMDRVGAEAWVGSGSPRVANLLPGRPADVYG